MNPSELTSPIRMFWDLGPLQPGLVDHRRIAGEIAANKILDVQITESARTLSPACFEILDTLKDKGISLSLAALPSALDAPAVGLLSALPLRMLLLSTRALDELGILLEIEKRTKGKPSVGLAFTVTRENFGDLPEVLAFCVQHRTALLALPMQRFTAKEECFTPSREEQRELLAALRQIERPGKLKIIIHDPFLWRAFFPSTEFPGGGCQAANTMLHISAAGDIYPCPSFPIKLGSLMSESLKEIIHSERKRELRASLTRPPQACIACNEAAQCRGGCRGRGWRMTGSLEAADPACR